MAPPLLEVDDLRTQFSTDDGVVRAVDGVSFTLERGETLAIVGESGSGKTVTALSIMGLVEKPAGRVVGGDVRYQGRSLVGLPPGEYRKLRGRELAMVFQDPMTSLNPVLRVGTQLGEAMLVHGTAAGKAEARARAVELLHAVGIPQAGDRVDDYPHQFSGGMRQRAMIAMAIANDPNVLIADEPTTALDVTIQAQIVEVLKEAQRRTGAAMILITHDLGLVAGVADRVVVMYGGRVMEQGALRDLYYGSRHPYTRGLMASLPRLDGAGLHRLTPIPGAPPSLVHPPSGCGFHPRCPHATDRCRTEVPELRSVGPRAHRSACHHAEELPDLAAAAAAAIALAGDEGR